MKSLRKYTHIFCTSTLFTFMAVSFSVSAADKALLDILLSNGAITESQHQELMKKPSLNSGDFGAPSAAEVEGIVERKVSDALDQKLDDHLDVKVEKIITDQVAMKVDEDFPVKVSHGSSGFRFETRDGNWQTNLQWRAQLRFTTPYRSDPRSLGNFANDTQNTFEARRVRMKIGGHGFRPWIGYYFEVDLQPTRDTGDDSESSSSRVIDWRVTLDKYKWAALRMGQWKIDYNRERVDSSGRQQFVERSIVNRQFTIDRQVGVQLRGRLFEETHADLRYYVGAFTGEGRGVRNDDDDLMWAGRLQWNFLGRDLSLRQTDVEYTELPTASLSFGAATNKGRCTRWSSSGCGNLSGFASPSTASNGQFEIDQYTQGFAFKYRGLSIQQEYHWKEIDDTVNNTKSEMEGAYVQSGYFFHHLIPAIPREFELAARYAFVDEPNSSNVLVNNTREEYTLGANWFFAGHNSKITADYSYLSLEDVVANRKVNDNRFRVQYDVSF